MERANLTADFLEQPSTFIAQDFATHCTAAHLRCAANQDLRDVRQGVRQSMRHFTVALISHIGLRGQTWLYHDDPHWLKSAAPVNDRRRQRALDREQQQLVESNALRVGVYCWFLNRVEECPLCCRLSHYLHLN
jgi:hypothetical protein